MRSSTEALPETRLRAATSPATAVGPGAAIIAVSVASASAIRCMPMGSETTATTATTTAVSCGRPTDITTPAPTATATTIEPVTRAAASPLDLMPVVHQAADCGHDRRLRLGHRRQVIVDL